MQTLTQTGMAVGTPAYMAPEQHLARPSSARSDQFAFCVATYEALYGQRPFLGDNYAELSLAVVEGRVVPPPRRTPVPAAAWQALRRGLHPDPESRYATLEDLLADLRDLLRPGIGGARLGLVAAVIALPAIAVIGYLSLQTDDPPEPAPEVAPRATHADSEGAAHGSSGEAAHAESHASAGEKTRPPVAPSEPSIALGEAQHVDAAALRSLLAEVVPAEAGRIEAEGAALALVGAGAKPWQEPLDQIIHAIDQPRRTPGAQVRVETPAGFWGVYELGTEGFERRVNGLRGLTGVAAVAASAALGVALARGDGPALDGVDRWAKNRPREPREWCFINTSLKNQESCKPTMRQCEEDRKSWLGDAADGKSRCYGKP